MDSTSSSVGFSLSGNPQSPENSTPLHSSSIGIPLSENLRSSGNLSPLLSSSSPVGIPLPESPQSPENLPILQLFDNEPPTNIITDEQWNIELTDLYDGDDFFYICGEEFFDFMTEGQCGHPFMDWFMCMHDVSDHDRNWNDCTELAGAVRDCVFANLDYYQELLDYFDMKTLN